MLVRVTRSGQQRIRCRPLCVKDFGLGAGPLGQPLHVRLGFIEIGFRTTGQGAVEHEPGGGLERASEQIGRTARLDYAHTAYPPLAQAFFLAVTRISETLVIMRLALVA